MAPTTPKAGQSEEAARLEAAVSAESLRDTRAGAPPDHGMLFAYQSGSRPLEGYTIKRGVGRGGFGEVYYATSDAGKEVALKLVRRNLEVELRGMTQCLNLKHPNLISLYDIRQDGHEAYWVVMEYVAGEGLEQILAGHPNGLPQEEAVRCMRQVCAGVAYLHDRGIVHRDLKPGNIFLDDGTYKIGDYGLSKFISHSRRSGQTESIGTVHYMAPEIANGRYGKEIDTYALGVIFYEMLTGHVPYEGESIGEVLMKHLTAEPDLGRVPAQFRPIVARLLRKDPDQRYPSVPALVEDIEAALSGKPLAGGLASVAAPRLSHDHAAAQSTAPQPKRLRASSEDCILSGVCGGFANYFKIDPVWVRLGFVLTTVLASGIPILIYFVLAVIMPSDEEDEEANEVAATEPVVGATPANPDRLRNLGLELARVFVSILFAVGVGFLAGGLGVLLFGWSNDAVYWIGPAAGLFTAAVAIGTRSEYLSIRALAVLLFSAAIGMGMAALALSQYLRDEAVAFLALGTAFSSAAVGLSIAFYRHPLLLWRFAVSLFAGLGVGFLIAAIVLRQTLNEEMTAFIAVGAGFLTAASAAYVLFFGALSPARQRRRQELATQVWAEGEAPEEDAPRMPRGLMVAAVICGLVPAGIYVLYRGSAESPRFGPSRLHVRHYCRAANCSQAATVVFSRESVFKGQYDRFEYCETHAQQSAWEARQNDKSYAVFDITNGEPRRDFDVKTQAIRR
jgi:phage shock protein PspC (stress-responsive transcriptional regulator)